jgi:hypothetical protein
VCPKCRHELTGSEAYCSRCGTLVGDSDAERVPPARRNAWEVILDRLREALAPRYRVIRLLGYGGMAGVYLAEEVRLERKVAIKVISPTLMVDPAQAERFEQEARTIARLDHPNIVTVYEVDERADLHFFTMTWVAGRTLGHVMNEAAAPLDLEVVRAWLGQVASALAYAHHRGVVHRDIKPSNILLDEAGNALVGDFGIAKVQDQEGLTRTGMLVGTPSYMSPEQCGVGEVTGASDQYALGAVAYQMITGEPPFSGPTMAVIQAHLNEPPPGIRTLRPDCPEELERAVMRMLAKRPEDRFPVLEAALDALSGGPLRFDDPARARMAALARWTEDLSVEVEPATATDAPLAPGDRFTIRAVARAADGTPLPDRRVEWSTNPGDILEVGRDGSVLAIQGGRARIEARAAGGVTREIDVSVARPGEVVAPEDPGAVAPRSFAAETAQTADAVDLEVEGPEGGAAAGEVADTVRDDAPATSTPAPAWMDLDDADGSGSATELVPGDGLGLPTPPGRSSMSDARPAPDAARRQLPVPGERSHTGPSGVDPAFAHVPATTPGAGPTRLPRGRALMLGGAAAAVIIVALGWMVLGGGGSSGTTATSPAADATPEQIADGQRPPGSGAEADGPDPATDGRGEDATGEDAAATTDEDETVTTADEAAAETRADADDDAVAPPPEVASPEPGTLLIDGDLPAGARLRVRGAGVDRTLAGGAVSLPPGRYDLDGSAPGFEPVSGSVEVSAGGRAAWRPTWVAVPVEAPANEPDPEPTPPGADAARSPEADQAAVLAAVQAFAGALTARDVNAIREVYPRIPADDLAQWRNFFATRGLRDLSVDAAPRSDIVLEGDQAALRFDLTLRYSLPGGSPPAQPVSYEATLVRSAGADWVIDELRQIG